PRGRPRLAPGDGRPAVVHLPDLVEAPHASAALRQLSRALRAGVVGAVAAAQPAAAHLRNDAARAGLRDPGFARPPRRRYANRPRLSAYRHRVLRLSAVDLFRPLAQ